MLKMLEMLARAGSWAASRLSRSQAGQDAAEGVGQAVSRVGWRRLLGRAAAGTAAAEVGLRATTGDGIAGNIATTAGDVIQRGGEEVNAANVNAANHGFGQKLINWGNNISIFLGGGEMAQWLGDILRNWGAQIQGSTHEGDDAVVGADADAEGFTGQFNEYATGLAEDFDPSQWSVENGLNLVNATANGAFVGTTSTLAWAGGQLADIVNVGNIFSDRDFSTEAASWAADTTNNAWSATVGAPDLNGHWAHAMNSTASFAVPAVGIARAARMISGAFNLSQSGSMAVRTADAVAPRAAPAIIGAP